VSPLCPRGKTGFAPSALFCWRPRRDLNPCYRRESIAAYRNTLYLQGSGRSPRPCKTSKRSNIVYRECTAKQFHHEELRVFLSLDLTGPTLGCCTNILPYTSSFSNSLSSRSPLGRQYYTGSSSPIVGDDWILCEPKTFVLTLTFSWQSLPLPIELVPPLQFSCGRQPTWSSSWVP